MRHLTIEQLVDLADGVAADSLEMHLQSCGACRRQLMDLRGMMSAVAEVDAPDPSPLFWDHFSARVRDAVNREHETNVSRSRGLRQALGARLASFGMRTAVVGGLAVLLAAVAILLQGLSFAPALAPSGRVSVAVEVPAAVSPIVPAVGDDPSLSLVADLVADLDWEAAREAGLTTHVGVDDDALNELTSGERGELRRLLQGELSPSRRGA